MLISFGPRTSATNSLLCLTRVLLLLHPFRKFQFDWRMEFFTTLIRLCRPVHIIHTNIHFIAFGCSVCMCFEFFLWVFFLSFFSSMVLVCYISRLYTVCTLHRFHSQFQLSRRINFSVVTMRLIIVVRQNVYRLSYGFMYGLCHAFSFSSVDV